MMKWIFGLLLLVNVLFFAVMRWGGALTVDTGNSPAQAAINTEKIKIVNLSAISAPVSAPASAVAIASAVTSAAASALAPSSPPVAAAPVKLSCMEWGEFSGGDLSRAEKALAAIKLGDKFTQHAVEHTGGYWVYIAPLKIRADIEQKIAQLKARGVTDYFVIQEAGQWQNAISLGVFKTEEAAKKYLAKLQERGVKTATVGERASKLKFTVFALNHLEPVQSAQLAALHKDFPESELKHVPCN